MFPIIPDIIFQCVTIYFTSWIILFLSSAVRWNLVTALVFEECKLPKYCTDIASASELFTGKTIIHIYRTCKKTHERQIPNGGSFVHTRLRPARVGFQRHATAETRISRKQNVVESGTFCRVHRVRAASEIIKQFRVANYQQQCTINILRTIYHCVIYFVKVRRKCLTVCENKFCWKISDVDC